MSDRVGLFVNVNNLFHYVNKRWEGKRLNYNEFVGNIDQMDNARVVVQIAYGTQFDDKVEKFQNALRSLNFELKYKMIEPDTFYSWDAGMAVDMVNWSSRLDVVVLATGNREMVPVVEYLKSQGVRVIIYAAAVHKELRQIANEVIEIEEYMLIDPSERNQDALPVNSEI